jgi:hypothetical protein
MNATLYTFGYLSARAERIFQELIAVRTPIVDIRFSPDSRNPHWKQDAIAARPGIIYHHIQELGNELYKQALTGQFTEPHIQIADIDTGLTRLEAILQEHKRAAIFCACSSKTKCHRLTVATEAQARLSVQIIHL